MSGYTLAAILVSVACTLSLRALPFLIFTKNRPMPEWLRRLGKTLPMAIMAVLVVYCLKYAFGDPVHTGIPQALGVEVAAAASYKWKHSTLLSILLGTATVMLLLRIL